MHHLLQGFGLLMEPDALASLRSREWGSSSGLPDVTADFSSSCPFCEFSVCLKWVVDTGSYLAKGTRPNERVPLQHVLTVCSCLLYLQGRLQFKLLALNGRIVNGCGRASIFKRLGKCLKVGIVP